MSKNKMKKKSPVPMSSMTSPVAMKSPLYNTEKQEISLCLVMIVKDEEDTMERCLKAVAPYIKYWVIVDNHKSLIN